VGHIRLGRRPKTLRWRQVVELLGDSSTDAPSVARATTEAADRRLRQLASDRTLVHCFWLLIRLTSAARESDFVGALRQVGVEVGSHEPILAFISRLSDQVREESASHPESGAFAKLASLALRRTLAETVGQHGQSLFGASADDLRVALRSFSADAAFARASRLFFADFFGRTLRSFVERELSNHIGGSPALRTVADSQEFSAAIERYTRESARIIEDSPPAGTASTTGNQCARSAEKRHGFVAAAMRKSVRSVSCQRTHTHGWSRPERALQFFCL
jgi:hypothetical protein